MFWNLVHVLNHIECIADLVAPFPCPWSRCQSIQWTWRRMLDREQALETAAEIAFAAPKKCPFTACQFQADVCVWPAICKRSKSQELELYTAFVSTHHMCVYIKYMYVFLIHWFFRCMYVYIYMYQDPQKTRIRGLSYRICRNPGELLICPQDSCAAPRIPALPQDSCTEQDFCDQSRNLVFCDVLAFRLHFWQSTFDRIWNAKVRSKDTLFHDGS
jgi:hypothetical protein